MPPPIAKHHPTTYTVAPQIRKRPNILIPPLSIAETAAKNPNYGNDFQEWALEALEWLGLVSLDSPRVRASDGIDPYLSRYRVPGHDEQTRTTAPTATKDLMSIIWQGFMPGSWVCDLLVQLR